MEKSKSNLRKYIGISLISASILGGVMLAPSKAHANTVNDYIKQGLTQKGWKAAKEENQLGGIKYKYNYNNGKGRPTMIINHDTANDNSNINGEIAYMTRNQESAFVHEFVDGNRMIGIADTDYLAWGAGPQGNGRGVQVEQVHVHSKDDFAKELINLAQFNVNIMKQYGLTPSLGQPNGSGSVWTHAMISRYLGGSDHGDPDGYWARSAGQWFGTTYNINDFYNLVNDMYYNRIKPTSPANVNASTNVRQDGGNFIADVTVSGDTSRITEVQVPTWTDPQQKDLKWYSATKINANTFRVIIPTSNHKSTGTYHFHTYVRTNDGQFKFKTAKDVNYIVNNVTGQTKHEVVNGKLVITTTLSGDVGRVTNVRVPLWSDPKQKDISWFQMTKKSNNVYEYVYDGLSNKNYRFINTHVYTTSDGWQDKNVTTNGFDYKAPTSTDVSVASSVAVDKVGTVAPSQTDGNLYQGNPPLTKASGKIVGSTTRRSGQTFRVLRETTLSNGKVYSYGLFGDKQYFWMASDNLKDVGQTPIAKTSQSFTTPKKYATINNNAIDIRKDDPRYRVASQYSTYKDVTNSNSAKSATVQVTKSVTYSNGEVWYEFTQSNKNGTPMGWVNSIYLNISK